MTFSPEDLQQIAERGIALATVEEQLQTFEQGLPFLRLDRPCTTGDGITVLDSHDIAHYVEVFAHAAAAARAMKLVPASGAASRMFQSLSAAADRGASLSDDDIVAAARSGDAEFQDAVRLLDNLSSFAFHDELKRLLPGKGLKDVLRFCLHPEGLDYANLPKALIQFHRYPANSRTPIEEHLVEARAYTQDYRGVSRIHFTVSPEHEAPIRAHLDSVMHLYQQSGTSFEISFSTQHASTDTIAVDDCNTPVRDQNGRLVFRPGGHGALLPNLEEIGGDIVFIKNIDNVVPDRLKGETARYKQALGGLLVEIQETSFRMLRDLESRSDREVVETAADFAKRKLGLRVPESAEKSLDRLRIWLRDRLDRPLRVCGVVRNTGEPGGGPFWARDADGELWRQIVESSQVDPSDAAQQEHWRAATHFNPVDLVCAMRDYRGRAFNLSRFVDHKTGFISRKSKGGTTLKALELPGLWNGAMAHWNTIFVEVPAVTFNPVKTVFDLLRPEHRG